MVLRLPPSFLFQYIFRNGKCGLEAKNDLGFFLKLRAYRYWIQLIGIGTFSTWISPLFTKRQINRWKIVLALIWHKLIIYIQLSLFILCLTLKCTCILAKKKFLDSFLAIFIRDNATAMPLFIYFWSGIWSTNFIKHKQYKYFLSNIIYFILKCVRIG